MYTKEQGSEFPIAKTKLDDFFLQWLSLPDTQESLALLFDDAKHDRPLQGPSSPNSPRSAHAKPTHQPPKSPTGAVSAKLANAHAEFIASPQRSPLPSPSNSQPKESENSRRAPPKEVIPQFYFPKRIPAPNEDVAELPAVKAVCAKHPKALTRSDFSEIIVGVYNMPRILSGGWFDKLDTNSTGKLTHQRCYDFCNKIIGHGDEIRHFFNLLKGDSKKQFVAHDDFVPFMKELLNIHPGLEFLKPTPEFQERYVETVIVRIFYSCNIVGDGKLTYQQIRKHNLLSTFRLLDTEKDINKITKYFSYEHFYVLYCKFWELDTDHDFLIDKEDVLRYANYSLTYRIVDRVFQEAPRKLTSGHPDKMSYADFIWFLLSEEDKTSATSFLYWFKCIDLNGNGLIEPDEMEYFYREQMHRMECLSLEVVAFADILCQLTDMVKIHLGHDGDGRPKVKGKILLRDMKRCRMGGNFFNVLFNLNKFIAFEQRDPAVIFQERMTPELTDWDRFAHAEYLRLSMEDEGEEMAEGEGPEAWGSGDLDAFGNGR